MLRIVETNSLEDLLSRQNDWASLLERTPRASYFQSLPWLAAHWRHAAADRKLRTLWAYRDERLVGVVPLNVQRESTQCGPMRVATFPLDGWGSFFGPIGERPAELLAARLRHLRRSRRDFDLIDLRPLPPLADDSIDELGRSLTPFADVAVLELHGDWNTYWDARRCDANRRRNVERCERRLAEEGEVTYVRYRPAGAAAGDADPRWPLYDQCEQLAGKSWQAGLVEGNTLSHSSVRGFLRDAHQATVDAGGLDLNLLYVGARPVAFVYAYHYRGYVDLLRVGFDPDWSRLAPGNALWTRLIRDSFARGDRILDFGPTCLDYKRFWATGVTSSYRYQRFSATPRAQLLRAARWLKQRTAPPPEKTNRENKRKTNLGLAKPAAPGPPTVAPPPGISASSATALPSASQGPFFRSPASSPPSP